MEADFSGYATKAGLKCSDGRTIMPNAFQHQDKMRVPLVWQHGHNDPENVLGHAILENREDGVYAYGFFNKSSKAQHAHGLIEHQDINMMSIWANELIERSKNVIHGKIREVSLVLSGANPGALIENVTIRHADGDENVLEDEAIIYTGLELEHDNLEEEPDAEAKAAAEAAEVEAKGKEAAEAIAHAAADEDETVEDIYNSMTEKQKTVLHFMVGEALDGAEHSAIDEDTTKALAAIQEGINEMKHNVFESDDTNKKDRLTLSHDDLQGIVADATKNGSLKESVQQYALAHGIEDIDILFPEARAIADVPEFLQRRNEWVAKLLGGTRKSPFSRIKTLSADLTHDEARAKGYIKGTLKKEEFFGVAKRVTTPTTVYKKQKLDRDDIVDITDFDVVVWLKSEMRIMLDEEIARAILLSDGRDVSHEDKINEGNIRPISKDHELFTTTLNVNINDANSSIQEVIDALVMNRFQYKGTGLPTLFTTETYIARFLLLKDTTGRRIYKTLDELATELRVAEVVPVEVMEEYADIVGVLVNPIDYVVGADKGGTLSMFDDFDIDYNQYKYLIETRLSGALVKLKSAIVIKKVAGGAALVAPTAPTFDPETGALTITNTTGVVYKHGDDVVNAASSPYTVPEGETWVIDATPSSGSYYFATSDDDSWSFTAED
jgi:hypothetical protein